jgi:hypothetical protein
MATQTLLVLAFLVVIAVAAPRYGVDSREPPPGELPRPHKGGPTVRGDLAALGRAVHRMLHSHRPRARISRMWPSSSHRSAR